MVAGVSDESDTSYLVSHTAGGAASGTLNDVVAVMECDEVYMKDGQNDGKSGKIANGTLFLEKKNTIYNSFIECDAQCAPAEPRRPQRSRHSPCPDPPTTPIPLRPTQDPLHQPAKCVTPQLRRVLFPDPLIFFSATAPLPQDTHMGIGHGL